jgi:hypothetical protein
MKIWLGSGPRPSVSPASVGARGTECAADESVEDRASHWARGGGAYFRSKRAVPPLPPCGRPSPKVTSQMHLPPVSIVARFADVSPREANRLRRGQCESPGRALPGRAGRAALHTPRSWRCRARRTQWPHPWDSLSPHSPKSPGSRPA